MKISKTRQFFVFFALHLIKSTLGFLLSIVQIFYLFAESKPIITPNQISLLRKNGLVSIENFMSKEDSDKLAGEISVHLGAKNPVSITESDLRLFKAEKSMASLEKFYSDKLLLRIGICYLGMPLRNSGTMANIVPPSTSEVGSGGSWHRDSNFPQYKALIYLSDVDFVEDGAFQYFPRSNKMIYIIQESIKSKRSISDSRWTNGEILKSLKGQPISITGKAGTLVLFDTSLLHRGSPNSNKISKRRIAITNYYYPVFGSIGDQYAK
jgi:hypothetical protein